jgi:hypothetical protein
MEAGGLGSAIIREPGMPEVTAPQPCGISRFHSCSRCDVSSVQSSADADRPERERHAGRNVRHGAYVTGVPTLGFHKVVAAPGVFLDANFKLQGTVPTH